MSDTNRELLEDLFTHTIENLLEKVKDGSATASELAVAARMLKDNGIDAIPKESNGLQELAEHLPFNGEETIEAERLFVEGI